MPPYGPYGEEHNMHHHGTGAPPPPQYPPPAGLPYGGGANYPPPPPPPPPPYHGNTNGGYYPPTQAAPGAPSFGGATGLPYTMSQHGMMEKRKKSSGILGSVKKGIRNKSKGGGGDARDDYLNGMNSFRNHGGGGGAISRQGVPPQGILPTPAVAPPADVRQDAPPPSRSNSRHNVPPPPFANGMESVYGATIQQVRRASEYHDLESQELLESLMPGAGVKLKKKEMEGITARAFEHANEHKRLLRKAELMEAEEMENMQQDAMKSSRGAGNFLACGGGDDHDSYMGPGEYEQRKEALLAANERRIPAANEQPPEPSGGDCGMGLAFFQGNDNDETAAADAAQAQARNGYAPPAGAYGDYNQGPPPPAGFLGQPPRPASPPPLNYNLSRRSVVIDEVRDQPPQDPYEARLEYGDDDGEEGYASDAQRGEGRKGGRAKSMMKGLLRKRGKSKERTKGKSFGDASTMKAGGILRGPSASRDPEGAAAAHLALSRSASGDLAGGAIALALSRSRSRGDENDIKASLSREQVIALALSRSKSREELHELCPTNDPEIAFDLHKAEEEITAMLEHDTHYTTVDDFLDDDDGDGKSNASSESAGIPVVAPSNLKIISKVSMDHTHEQQQKRQARKNTKVPRPPKPKKEQVITNLATVTASLTNHDKARRRRSRSFSSNVGPTNVSLASPMAGGAPNNKPKRRNSFKQGVISRLITKGGGNKSSSRGRGKRSSPNGQRDDDDGPMINEYVVHCLSLDKASPPGGGEGGSLFTAPPLGGAAAKNNKQALDGRPMNKSDVLYQVTHEPAALGGGKPPLSSPSEGGGEDGRGLKRGGSFAVEDAPPTLRASDSFQMLIDAKKEERMDRLDLEAKMDALAVVDPSPSLRKVPSDPPMLSPTNSMPGEDRDDDGGDNFVQPIYAQVEVGSVITFDNKVMNTEEIAEAIKRTPSFRSPASPVQRQRSNNGMAHDDHDVVKASDSFTGFLDRKRNDALQRKEAEEKLEALAYRNAHITLEDDTTHDTPASFVEDGEEPSYDPYGRDDDHEDYAEENLTKTVSMKERVGKMKRRLSLKRGGKKRDDEIPPTSPSSRTERNSICSSNFASSRALSSRANSSKGVQSSRQGSYPTAASDGACFDLAPSVSTENYSENLANRSEDPMSGIRRAPTNSFQGATMPMQQSKTDMLLQKMSNDSYNAPQTHVPTPADATPLPAPKPSPYPALADSRASLQRSSSRANKKNVDNLLRQMRNDSSDDDGGSDSEYDSDDNSVEELYPPNAAQNDQQDASNNEGSDAEQDQKGWFGF